MVLVCVFCYSRQIENQRELHLDMTTYKTRTANLGETTSGRTSLRMTNTEWDNLERLADDAGTRWLDWARQAVRENNHLPKVAAIRKSIREALIAEKTGRLESAAQVCDHPYVNQARFFGDDDLEAIKSDLREVWAVDCSSFIVRFGFNRLAKADSDPLMVIENRLRDGMHMAIAASYQDES